MAILAQVIDDVVVQRFELKKPTLTIGRRPDNDIQIDDTSVSGNHAAVHRQPNPDFPDYIDYFIEDLGSTNGTKVNDTPIKGKQILRNNDMITVAWNSFRFIDDEQRNFEKTTHMI